MNESSSSTPTKRKFTVVQMIAIALGIAALTALGGMIACQRAGIETIGDEPPIRVRNGSMKIELLASRWNQDGNDHIPERGHSTNRFYVLVEPSNTPGNPFQGLEAAGSNQVVIRYSNISAPFRFHVGGGKTRVSGQGISIDNQAPRRLWADRGGNGFITEVTILRPGLPDLRCGFVDAAQAAQLESILIIPY